MTNNCCYNTGIIILAAFVGIIVFWFMNSIQPVYINANSNHPLPENYLSILYKFIINRFNTHYNEEYDESKDLMNSPFFRRMLLRIRKDGKLKSIEELSEEEMDRSMTYGRSFDSTYINMEIYLNQSWPGKNHFGFRDRSCISHQHLIGYEGPAKKFVVVALNDGNRFIRMTNMSMVGHGNVKAKIKYSSTLCPDKVTRLEYYNSIDVKYRPYHKIVPYRKGKHDDKYYYLNFEGEKAYCLQIILDEFKGINVCNNTFIDISK